MSSPPKDDRPSLLLVAGADVSAEGLAMMQKELRRSAVETGEPLLPDGPRDGVCRVCGRHGAMTEEHVPPRGAGNVRTGREADVHDHLISDELDPPESGPVVQGGIRGYTLCEECNGLTGRMWGREYQEWARRAQGMLANAPKSPPEIDEEPGFPCFPGAVFKGVFPGRFIRQVLSMMLTISGSAGLGTRHPVLRELVLGGPPTPLPDPLRLHFMLYGSSTARIMGGPFGQAWYEGQTSTMRRVLQLDFPPLAFMLTVDGPPPDEGVDISVFADMALDHRIDASFDGLPVGFGHKMWPGDYRTRGQLLADRVDLDGV